MAVLLGLLTALDFGTADFLGGLAARRSPAGAVVAGAQVTSAVAGLLLLAVFWPGLPSGHDVELSVAGGAFNMLALGALFRGLAMGRMSVVAPIAAAVGAVLPVIWGMGFGERPSALALVGVAVAVIAVVLIARGPEAEPTHEGSRLEELALSVGAGVGFGIAFLFFSETSHGAGYWPATLSRAAGAALAIGTLALLRRPMLAHRSDRSAVAGSGVFDATGMGFLLLATHVGGSLRSIVAPVASLYPASTVLLARLLLKERITGHQVAGLTLAGIGLMLIAVG